MTTLAHTCEDGHSWVEQEDGGVSPSWGMGLTSVRFEQGPRACPEPARDDDGQYECAGCGGRFYMGHGTPGVMSDPWNYDPACKPPEPACGKAPTRTEQWIEGAGRGKTRTFGGWEEILPEPLTNATGKGMIASAGNPEPQEVPMTTKAPSTAKIEQLRTAYMTVYGGFSASRTEVADAVGVSVNVASGLLNKLRDVGLICGVDVNDEAQGDGRRGAYSEIEWQCNETYDSIDSAQATYLFDLAFGLVREEPEDYDAVEERVEQARKMLDSGDAEGALGTLLAPKPETVTLVAKSTSTKHAWHFRVNEDGPAVCGVRIVGGNWQTHRDVDRRVVRFQGRPVCSNCAARFNNGNTTTEEVTMSTTAATASTEARPDPKPSARTGTRSSSGPGRGHAAPETETTPAKAKAAKAKAIDIDDGLDKALIAQVKKALAKPELTSPPSGSYTIIRSDGYKVGGYRPLSRKGLCVMLPAAVSAVKQAVKGADVEKFEKNVYRSRVFLTKAEQVPAVVKLLVQAAKEATAADK